MFDDYWRNDRQHIWFIKLWQRIRVHHWKPFKFNIIISCTFGVTRRGGLFEGGLTLMHIQIVWNVVDIVEHRRNYFLVIYIFEQTLGMSTVDYCSRNCSWSRLMWWKKRARMADAGRSCSATIQCDDDRAALSTQLRLELRVSPSGFCVSVNRD